MRATGREGCLQVRLGRKKYNGPFRCPRLSGRLHRKGNVESVGPTPTRPPIRAVPFVFEANAAAAASRRLPVRPGVGTNPGEENLIRGISIMQRVLRRLIAAGRATTISGHHMFYVWRGSGTAGTSVRFNVCTDGDFRVESAADKLRSRR